MKEHSSKYLNAVPTSMVLATVGLQGLLPNSAKDACNYHSARSWEGLTEGVPSPWEKKRKPQFPALSSAQQTILPQAKL